jgi:hypothetical protein
MIKHVKMSFKVRTLGNLKLLLLWLDIDSSRDNKLKLKNEMQNNNC